MRTKPRPSTGPDARTLADAAKVAALGLALWGAVQLASALLERRPTALSLVQAAVAEWGAGRIGISWSDPLAPMPSARAIGRRAGRGALLGGAAATLVIGAAWVSRAAVLAPSSPSLGLLAVGLFASALAAVRDELILRGVVLRTTRDLFPRWVSLLVCGLAAAASRFGVDGVLSTSVAAEGLRGVALGALWMHDRGTWMAWAANASWMWTLGSLAQGGVVDVRFAAEGESAASSVAVLVVAALIAFLTLPSSASIQRRNP
jgi:hypothetical protein